MNPARVIFFIGHRGVGKTSLAFALANENSDLKIWDLDQQIEENVQKSVNDLFSQEGEERFRFQERETFNRLLLEIEKKGGLNIVVLGAGFQFDLPKGSPVFWIQRRTDLSGRIFLDRPRLEEGKTALDEFFLRYNLRDQRFSQISDLQILIPEGFNENWISSFYSIYLKEFFSLREDLSSVDKENGVLTLRENWFEKEFLKEHILAYLKKGIGYFELRDDLLSVEEIQNWKKALPEDKILLSLRKKDSPLRDKISSYKLVDWALELGEPPETEISILSRHDFELGNKGLSKGLEEFTQWQERRTHVHLKAAPIVETWQELILGHQWFMQDPENRSFLPRSSNGRWQWYRLLHMNFQNQYLMELNFFSESLNHEVLDQPTSLQWMSLNSMKKKGKAFFAAILGSPVAHSLTPIEQEEFFTTRGWPVVAIDLKENELTQENLNFLKQLGLRAAAVTSPLKKKMLDFCQVDTLAQGLQGVNTIFWCDSDQVWLGTNTDRKGFESLSAVISSQDRVLVWGGGGTLGVIQSVLPQAETASVRTGRLRDGSSLQSSYDVVIWAAGQRGENFPNLLERPRLVVDLSYMENSMAKEFCLQWEPPLDYCSGLEMFREQAKAQRDFWGSR